MKAVQWVAPRDMRLIDIPVPEPKPGEARLKIESVGVCGSDMHYYVDGRIGSQVITEPLILGHEYAGIVDAVGPGADESLIGERVAPEPGIPCMKCEWCAKGHYNVCRNMFFPGGPGCQGALAEYFTVPAAFCHRVPDNVTHAEASIVEPVAVAVHAVELANLQVGETAAVIGLGPIGLLTAQVLHAAGAAVIYGADLHQYRVDIASQFNVDDSLLVQDKAGADTVEWIMDHTNGRGVDVAFDCTNASEGAAISCLVTRPAGRVVLVGISGEEDDKLPVSTARRREHTFLWCRRFRFNYPAALDLFAKGIINTNALITHSFGLEDTVKAFDIAAGYAENVLKISIEPELDGKG